MKHLWAWLVVLCTLLAAGPAPAQDPAPGRLQTRNPSRAPDFRVLSDTRPPNPFANLQVQSLPAGAAKTRVLLVGDSWAQYMWDDGSHNLIFDRFGCADKRALSESLDPGPENPPYTGPAYAVSGSEARQWVDTANYTYLANVIGALNDNPTVDVVMLSIGGNDVLAGRLDGGWYKDMDLDVPGSEAALFAQIEANSFQIIDAAKAVRPDVEVLISSYDYPNFNISPQWVCDLYACDERENLSRDPVNELITDEELNGMMITVENQRIGWAGSAERVLFDNSVGLMHYFYGDGVSAPLTLPRPGKVPPMYLPFPGGNPLLPTLRSNFRPALFGIDADPIHLDVEGYRHKIVQQTEAYFFPKFRGDATETFFAQGGNNDGWTDGTTVSTTGIRIGDSGGTGTPRYFGIVSFDTSNLPDGAVITAARFYLTRQSASGTNPFAATALGIPTVDIASGSFGNPQVEAGDAGAFADFTDAGYLAGSAQSNGFGVGVEIDPSALSAVNTQGLTQFRCYFPASGSSSGADAVTFADGDDTGIPGGFPTLAAYMGTSQPFLDVTYDQVVGIGDEPAAQTLPRMLPNSPNPFTSSTSIRFLLDRPAHVRVDVVDIRGRLVNTLREGLMEEGSHAVTWDGRDRTGTRVAAGVYLAVLKAGDVSRSRKVVLAN
jgi:hypothetical protein